MKTRLQSSTEDKTTPFGSKPQGRVAAFLNPFQKFQKDEEGSIIIFSLFMFAIMLMIGGLAVDVMRAEYRRANLQYSADRCALNAASISQALDPEDVALDCLDKSQLGSITPNIDVTEVTSSSGAIVSRTVKVEMPDERISTIFLGVDWGGVFGLPSGAVTSLATPVAATAQSSERTVEISLVLDISGSMFSISPSSGQQKIAGMRQAAKQFVDVISGGAITSNPSYFISVVPYAADVNIGHKLGKFLNISNDHHTSHCVYLEDHDFQNVALDHSGAPLQRVPNHGETTFMNMMLGILSPTDTVLSYVGNCLRSELEIMPFETDPDTLKNEIDGLYPTGAT